MGDEEARNLKKTLGLGWNSSSSMKVARKGKKKENFSLYREWGWVPPLKNLVGAKTCVYGL